MGIILIFAAYLLGAAAIQDELGIGPNAQGQKGLFQVIANDVANTGFLAAVVAIVVVGIIGDTSKTWRHASYLFLFLILLVSFVANKGVFSQVTQAISNPSAESLTPNAAALPQGNPTINVGGGSSSSPVGTAASAAGGLFSFLGGL